jgi:hypothetical protein
MIHRSESRSLGVIFGRGPRHPIFDFNDFTDHEVRSVARHVVSPKWLP